MAKYRIKTLWYADGLAFECQQCGRCCAGPDEGRIWVTRPEVELIADFLKISPGEFRRKYLRRLGLRSSIIEQPITKDCIFLQKIDGQKKCVIYPVRPNQCRSWPFWPSNLAKPAAWNAAAQKCPGINRGKKHSFEEIQQIRKKKKWWLEKIV
jgi:Fe-S-cluster containining protein